MNRNFLIQLFAIVLYISYFPLVCNAGQKHILERGESLESIAQKYGITTQQIIELNPDAATFTYIGMELIIPEVAKQQPASKSSVEISQTPDRQPPLKQESAAMIPQQSSTTARNSTASTRHQEPETAIDALVNADYGNNSEYNLFSMAALMTWDYNVSGEGGDFKSRSAYGVYAEGCSELSPNFGLGMAYGFQFNFGLVPKDYSSMIGILGPTLAFSFGEYKTAGFYLPVCVGMGYSLAPTQDDILWSCVILPHFAFSLNRVRINAGCQIVTDFKNSSFGILVGIGYEF